MAKERIAIPKLTKESLLKEYNHRCSICGTSNPHIHHIDENPSNNKIENLLPLCPNCHLIDHHNPTSNISPSKLKLFRKFKDPTLLSNEFEPLYRRMTFLTNVKESDNEYKIRESISELIEFVASLKMGNFYSKQIKKLIQQPLKIIAPTGLHGDYYPVEIIEWEKQFQRLIQNREMTHSLCVELLRYQDWQYKPK